MKFYAEMFNTLKVNAKHFSSHYSCTIITATITCIMSFVFACASLSYNLKNAFKPAKHIS